MTLRRALPSLLSVLAFSSLVPVMSAEIPCEDELRCHGNPSCRTSNLWFEAESLSGASGDVLGVTISLFRPL